MKTTRRASSFSYLNNTDSAKTCGICHKLIPNVNNYTRKRVSFDSDSVKLEKPDWHDKDDDDVASVEYEADKKLTKAIHRHLFPKARSLSPTDRNKTLVQSDYSNSDNMSRDSSVILLSNNNNNNYDAKEIYRSQIDTIELLRDIKNKSQELVETEKLFNENNSLINSNKKKIQDLEIKLLQLEKQQNENEKNNLKKIQASNERLSKINHELNSIRGRHTTMSYLDNKDLYQYPLFSTQNKETTNLRKEINKLKFDIDGLKFDNSRLSVKTSSLEAHMHELQYDINSSVKKTDKIQKILNEDESNHRELTQLLNEIRATKQLLRNSQRAPQFSIKYTNDYDIPLANSRNYSSTTKSNYIADKPFTSPGYTSSYTSFPVTSYLSYHQSRESQKPTYDYNSNEFNSKSAISFTKPLLPEKNVQRYQASTTFTRSGSYNFIKPSYESKSFIINDFDNKFYNDYSPMNETPLTSTQKSDNKLIQNTYTKSSEYLNQKETLNNDNKLDFDHSKESIKLENYPTQSQSEDIEKLKIECNKLRDNCNKYQEENEDLKKKVFEAEKLAISKRKHAEILQSMYNRILNYLPEKEAELIKLSTEFEKINALTDNYTLERDVDSNDIITNVKEIRKIDQDNLQKQKQIMRELITKLNEENKKLNNQLEELKSSNASELLKLNKYSSENSQLRRELASIKKIFQSETSKTATSDTQLKNEIDNLRMKLEHEYVESDKMKEKYESELHSAKLRYEAEINKQNALMQEKYDAFAREITTLNKIIKELKEERQNLMYQLEKERNINKELMENPNIQRALFSTQNQNEIKIETIENKTDKPMAQSKIVINVVKPPANLHSTQNSTILKPDENNDEIINSNLDEISFVVENDSNLNVASLTSPPPTLIGSSSPRLSSRIRYQTFTTLPWGPMQDGD